MLVLSHYSRHTEQRQSQHKQEVISQIIPVVFLYISTISLNAENNKYFQRKREIQMQIPIQAICYLHRCRARKGKSSLKTCNCYFVSTISNSSHERKANDMEDTLSIPWHHFACYTSIALYSQGSETENGRQRLGRSILILLCRSTKT